MRVHKGFGYPRKEILGVASGTQIIYDAFNGVAETSLLNHTPDVNLANSQYTWHTATTINNYPPKLDGGGYAWQNSASIVKTVYAVINAKETALTLRSFCSAELLSGFGAVGISCRWQDAANHYTAVRYELGGVCSVYLMEHTSAGVSISRGSFVSSQSVQVESTLQIVDTGTIITVTNSVDVGASVAYATTLFAEQTEVALDTDFSYLQGVPYWADFEVLKT